MEKVKTIHEWCKSLNEKIHEDIYLDNFLLPDELPYPDSFELEKNEFVDQSKFVKNVRNIKIALTRHVGGITLYHIFFNISGVSTAP